MNAPPSLPRTGMVTVMAKISLLLGAVGVAVALLQLLGALLMSDAAVAAMVRRPEFPAGLAWMLEWRVWLSWLCLLLSVLFLASAWGLLRRHPWARWVFIAFLVGGAALNFAGLAVIDPVFDGLIGMFPAEFLDTREGREFVAQMQGTRLVSWVTGGIGALTLAVLHGWIVWKLCIAPARDEFRQPGR